MERHELLGYGGAAALILGAFLPLIRLPMAGSLNYFHNGVGDGVIIVALALVSFYLVAKEHYRGLYVTGGLTLVVLAFTFFNFHTRMSEVRRQMEIELADNPFRGVGEMLVQSVQLEWGWAVLGLGVVALLVAGGLGEARKSRRIKDSMGSTDE